MPLKLSPAEFSRFSWVVITRKPLMLTHLFVFFMPFAMQPDLKLTFI